MDSECGFPRLRHETWECSSTWAANVADEAIGEQRMFTEGVTIDFAVEVVIGAAGAAGEDSPKEGGGGASTTWTLATTT